MYIMLIRSPIREKKWRVVFSDGDHVDFGARGYQDYTMHKDPNRREQYIARHKAREDWTRRGLKTAGFWSRWLLWEKTSIRAAKTHIQNEVLRDKYRIMISPNLRV
jgi:hypothetical protein